MSPLAMTTFAWGAVYVYLCAFYLLLYARSRTAREYLSFGLLAGAFALYCIANAFYLDGGPVLLVRIGDVGLFVTTAFYVEFVFAMLGRRSKLVTFAYFWAGAGLLLQVGGWILATDPEFEVFARWGNTRPFPDRTLIGHAHVSGLWILATVASAHLFRSEGPSDSPLRAMRPIARTMLRVSAILLLFTGAHEASVRCGFLAAPPLMEHGGLLFVFVVSHHLLDRFVGASDELAETTAELGTMYEELKDTQEKLVRKEQLAAVGELSAVIAHEVRNPLAIIKNAVSGLRRPKLRDDDRRTLLGILDEETGRLNRLVHDLLAYARPVVPRGRSLPIRELLRRSVERARGGVAHADEVEVRFELSDEVQVVHGDPELLRHALVNVMENAMQAMAGGGTLTIEVEPADLGGRPAAALSFTDTGEGMDTLVRAKARDPFFTTRPSGTGLGLAIVERVVRNHGGEVSIESRHGLGTTITFVLPVDPPGGATLPSPGEPRVGRVSAIRLPRHSSVPPLDELDDDDARGDVRGDVRDKEDEP